jgi:hypothetical protein
MSTPNAVRNVAVLRIAIGAASWVAPRLAGRLFGLDVAGNPQSPYIARLFGARDLVLGLGALQNSGGARRQWLQAGMACDVADTLAGLAGRRDGTLPRATAFLVTGTAVAAIVQSAGAIRAVDQESRSA